MNKNAEAKLETKNKINEVIQLLVATKKFDEITIREICRLANISLGSFYNYYPNKEAIVIEAIAGGLTFTVDYIGPRLTGKNGYENLKIYLTCQCELYEKTSIDWLRVVVMMYLNHNKNALLDRTSINYLMILELVKSGQKDQSISTTLQADDLAWLVLKIIFGNMFAYCMEDGGFDIKNKTVEEVLAIALK